MKTYTVYFSASIKMFIQVPDDVSIEDYVDDLNINGEYREIGRNTEIKVYSADVEDIVGFPNEENK